MQRQIFNSYRGRQGKHASRFGALLAMAGLLLSACDGGGNAVTENNLPEPVADGAPPVLTTVTMQPTINVEVGDQVKLEFKASEAIMIPIVTINGVEAEVTGKILEWSAVHTITEGDPEGFVNFEISYQDISGNLGETVTATTNNRVACFGEEGVICPAADDLGPLEGKWQLDFAGVGPVEGDYQWFEISDTGPDGPRACWFDDIYEFGRDGSFRNVQGEETYREPWQGVAEGCGAPIAPHDGSNSAVFQYDEAAGTLKLTGLGAHLGLPKVVNGGELGVPADAVESITYNVFELIGDSLTVRISVGGGWWEFRFTRISNLPIVGKWKLNFAGVGPVEGDYQWFEISDTGPDGPRACWFDDIYHFVDDGSFQNYQDGLTYLEPWQGVAEGCGVPVAPHDGSAAGAWFYDEAGTVTLNGLGSYLGLPKVVNGGELGVPADAVESITYNVFELIGDSLTVRISVGGGWWEFRFERIADTADLSGKWQLDFAGVGPVEGDYQWFEISDTGPDGPRACWFDDIYEFGRDGSFRNVQGEETYREPWQGVAEGCGAPIAPHDGSNNAIFQYDEAAGTLKLTGLGAHLGLPKVVNGGELGVPADAVESITYNVFELIGDSLTVRISVGGGWWEFRFTRISNLPVVGNWKLDFAGVGPVEGDYQWFEISDTGPDGPRACWFDDIYHFGGDGSFQNYQEGLTYLEPWQGVAEGCGVPVAPHDGSAAGAWFYDEAGTVTLDGLGSYLGLPKVVNGGELGVPADAVESITYNVFELIGDNMTVRISVGGGWWEFRFLRE